METTAWRKYFGTLALFQLIHAMVQHHQVQIRSNAAAQAGYVVVMMMMCQVQCL